jgi:hypothetical protein
MVAGRLPFPIRFGISLVLSIPLLGCAKIGLKQTSADQAGVNQSEAVKTTGGNDVFIAQVYQQFLRRTPSQQEIDAGNAIIKASGDFAFVVDRLTSQEYETALPLG